MALGRTVLAYVVAAITVAVSILALGIAFGTFSYIRGALENANVTISTQIVNLLSTAESFTTIIMIVVLASLVIGAVFLLVGWFRGGG